MTRFIRLLVVAEAVDEDEAEVKTRSSMEILFFTAWYSQRCRVVRWHTSLISICRRKKKKIPSGRGLGRVQT